MLEKDELMTLKDIGNGTDWILWAIFVIFAIIRRDIYDYAVFPVVSILICVFFDRIKRLKKENLGI